MRLLPAKLPWSGHPPGLYVPHSLVPVDLDRDGRPDIVAGEMTAGGWKFPLHDNPTVYAFMNQGGLAFRREVLHQGAGAHEMRSARVGPNGRRILYAADEIQLQKFPDMITVVSMWEIR